MPKFDSSVLGDWIQILASVGVVVGIALLVVELVRTRQLLESEHPDPGFNTASATQGVSLEESPVGLTKERQSELRRFVELNCPACHGARVTGGIGPELSKASLQHLSVNAVTLTILHGHPAKGMPGWESQLSSEDAYWIAKRLKRGRIIE